jgi:hypothetical protein
MLALCKDGKPYLFGKNAQIHAFKKIAKELNVELYYIGGKDFKLFLSAKEKNLEKKL